MMPACRRARAHLPPLFVTGFALICLLAAAPCFGESRRSSEEPPAVAAPPEEGPPHEEGHGKPAAHHDKNHLSFFAGITDEGAEEAGTFGVDYERRLDERFGIGFLADFAGGEIDSRLLALPLTLHLGHAFRLVAAPGMEKVDKEGEESEEFTVRLGAAYDVHFDAFSLSPIVNVDFVDGEEVYVYGVELGWSF